MANAQGGLFMRTPHALRTHLVWIILFLCPASSFAEELKPVQLPNPQTDIGRPLMEVLKDRGSMSTFSSEPLPRHVVSNLLWAAFGINRPESSGRTASSASNRQEIDIHVATAEGLYVYDAKENRLNPIVHDDVRGQIDSAAH
jgi:hypothetical protein